MTAIPDTDRDGSSFDAARLSTLVMADDTAAALRAAWGELAEAVPELGALAMDQGGRSLHKDNVAHTIAVTAKMPARLRLRLAALFHDVGKPPTRRITGGVVTFHDHERVGARITRRVLARLGFDRVLTEEVTTIVRLSGATKDSTVWSDAAVRRFVLGAGEVLEDLLVFAELDVTSRHDHKHKEVQAQVARLRAHIADVTERDTERARRPVIDGRAVMDRYGLDPGPRVGELLAAVLAAGRDGELTEEDAWALLDVLVAPGPGDASP